MATVAVLGGGISGLSCAHYLKTLGRSKIKYTFLLEKSPKFGGWIDTTIFPDGAICEHGPRTLRLASKSGRNALILADELGLGPEIISPSKRTSANLRRFVAKRNQVHAIPENLKDIFLKVEPFEKALIRTAYKEITTPKGSPDLDESLYDFGLRRLGKDVAEYLLDPMCRGICGGDSKEISVRSLIPKLYHYEQDHGSVIKGMFKEGKKDQIEWRKSQNNHLVIKAHNEKWESWSLKNGLASYIDALACESDERGICDLHVNADCSKLSFSNNKVVVTVDGEDIEVDHVFSSIPSIHLAPLLPGLPVLSSHLSSISCVTLAVVYLEYNNCVLQHNGFGFLTPSSEDSKVLGVIFDSCCFPQHNGINKTRLTCMMGGKWFNEFFGSPESVSNELLLNTAVEELKKHLEITDPPSRFKILVQKDCIPQYIVGHHKKLTAIEEEIGRNNLNLSLIGASYYGAGVPDCIYNAKLSVENFLKSL